MDERYENEKRLNPKNMEWKSEGDYRFTENEFCFWIQLDCTSILFCFFFIFLTALAGTEIDILITNGISLRFSFNKTQ